MSAAEEWVDRMVREYPGGLPKADATEYELDAHAEAFADWARSADPVGYQEHAQAFLRTGIERLAEHLLDGMVLDGRLTAERGPDGETIYRKVTA